MIAATIVVFREILEISLIIGIISAALNNLKNKNNILFTSILGGIFFSGLLALSISYISSLFDNNGQEVLNIFMLSISIICMNFTIIWLNQHRAELSHKINKKTEKFLEQKISILAIIIFITLAITREGAELVLFLKGVSAYTNNEEMVYGSLIGLTLGITCGLLVYSGLLRMHIKYFFKIINIMLILLIGGMSSQLANYLNSADLVYYFSNAAWDSSWLINENGDIGKILYNVFGCSSRPSELQVIFYFTNITITSILLFRTSNLRNKITK